QRDLEGRLLPAGRLREYSHALHRADVVVSENDLAPYLSPEMRFRLHREIAIDGEPPKTVVAFCGIATPQRFFAQLQGAGFEILAEHAFPDHHSYSTYDIDRLLEMRQSAGAAAFATTEKDAINLGPFAGRLQPLVTPRVVLRVDDGDRLVDRVAALAERRSD